MKQTSILSKKRILIVSVQGLGDLIMIYPCLKILDWNKIEYDIIVKDDVSIDLLKMLKLNHLNKIYTIKNIFNKLIFKKYDLVIPQSTISPLKYILFSFYLRCFYNGIIIYKLIINNSNYSVHTCLKNFRLFKSLFPNLAVKENDFLSQFYYNHIKIPKRSNTVLIAPGGGVLERHKHLPSATISKLIHLLFVEKNNYKFIIIGGQDTISLANNIVNEVKNYDSSINIYSVAGETNFYQLFSLISSSKIVISACNGISHIAGFLGATIYGFYGPTNPNITGPFTQNLYTGITNLSCAPCYTKANWRGCGQPVCMQNFDLPGAVRMISSLLK